MSKIPVSKVVRVTVSVSPTFPTRAGFGLLCIFSDEAPSNVLNTAAINFYSDIDQVSDDYASTKKAYQAAQIFFSQNPRPEQVAIATINDGESISDALTRVNNVNSTWYGFTFANTAALVKADILEAAAWAEPRIKIFGYTTASADSLDAAIVTDAATELKTLLRSRTIGQYDNNDPYAVISAMSRIMSVDFTAKDSTITLKFKQEPGVTPIDVTETQRQALAGKNLNYYTYFGDSAMIAEGVVAGGRFIDEVIGLDWLQSIIENQVFGYLYTRTTKVPQTDRGVASLVHQATIGFDAAVNCGLLAPGQWNGSDLGEIKNGDFLPKGYYVYAPKVASQSQSDRELRKSPPIQAICKGAGAIHLVDIAITFER